MMLFKNSALPPFWAVTCFILAVESLTINSPPSLMKIVAELIVESSNIAFPLILLCSFVKFIFDLFFALNSPPFSTLIPICPVYFVLSRVAFPPSFT